MNKNKKRFLKELQGIKKTNNDSLIFLSYLLSNHHFIKKELKYINTIENHFMNMNNFFSLLENQLKESL